MKGIINNLRNKLNDAVDSFVVRGRLAVHDVISEERGATDFVAIAVIIVVLLVVVVAFKNQLINIINTLGDKVTDWINSN